MTDTNHFCELPEPSLNMADRYSRGRSYQCPVCHAEWMVVLREGDSPASDEAIWMQRVSAEEAAKQVEDLMHELAHEDIDPAVIRAHVQHASFAVQQIVSIVGPSHGDAAATVIREGWNRFVRMVHPYFLDEPCDHHSFMEGRPNASGT